MLPPMEIAGVATIDSFPESIVGFSDGSQDEHDDRPIFSRRGIAITLDEAPGKGGFHGRRNRRDRLPLDLEDGHWW